MNATLHESKPAVKKWPKRVLTFCAIIFAFEVGLFLLVFPWLQAWGANWAAAQSPRLAHIWFSPYFRGALSGLGLLNMYIALVEFFKQLKAIFAPKT